MKNDIYSDFDIEMTQNRITNDLDKRKDEDAIKQSLILLIKTMYYDRKWHPEIGSFFKNYLFNLSDSYILLLAKQEIINLINNYEPRVRVNNVEILQKSNNTAIIQVKIDYTIINLLKNDTFVYTINRLR